MAESQPEFTLKVGAFPAGAFRIRTYTATEAMSSCYAFQIEAVGDEPDISYEDVIGKQATLSSRVDGKELKNFGVVTEFRQFPETEGLTLLQFKIEPRLALLQYGRNCRIFQNKKVPDILKEVLEGAGLGGQATKFELKDGSYPIREYVAQYNESDFSFLSRLMEQEGIFYFFTHEGSAEILVVADANSAAKPLPQNAQPIFYQDVGLNVDREQHVRAFHRTSRLVTGKATIKDWFDRTPDVNVLGSATGKGQGEDYRFGDNVRNTDEAGRLANLRTQQYARSRVVCDGAGDCRDFRPGFRFKLKDDTRSGFDGDYLIVQVNHHGVQGEVKGGMGEYSNTFQAIPAEVPFRPEESTPKPRVNGVLTAKIDGMEGKYAYLDEDGRYRAKLPFDLSSAKDGNASCPVRMSQPYSGPGYGMHFPVHVGTEVVLGFVDGDVDRPIALGTVPNPANASPVSNQNNSSSMIRTAAGHEIQLEDKEGKTALNINTSGKHTLSLNDDPDNKGVFLKTTDAYEMAFDDKNQNIRIATAEGGHLLKMDNKNKVLNIETKYGHKLTMDDEKKSMAVQTKKGHIFKLDDDGDTITVQDGKGKHTFQIDVGGGLITIKTDGDMEFVAKGALNIQAKEISMEAKQGAINAKAMKDIALDGMNVNVKAKQKFAAEANMEVSIKGSVGVKIEGGATFEAKGGATAKVAGAMVNVEAQAINTIKGAMVMIN